MSFFDSIPKNDMSLSDVLAFLQHYGYFEEIIDSVFEMPLDDLKKKVQRKKFSDKKLVEAVYRYQAFSGIKADGEFGPQTMREMSRPRCGYPDIMPKGARRAGSCQWPHKDVSYAFDLTLNGVSAETVNQAFVEACNNWNDVCGLRLHKIDDLNRANIWARSRRIDGRGGTLAWSFLPCGASKSTRLEQRYDPGENWNRAFLTEVIGHEVGHAIGLDHMNGNSLMHPTATGSWPVPQEKDIREVVRRYGPPEPKPEPPTPEPPDPEGGPVVTGTITIDGYPYQLNRELDFGAL